MVFLLDFYAISMRFLLDSYKNSIGFSGGFSGISIVFVWDFFAIAIGFLLDSCGVCMICL